LIFFGSGKVAENTSTEGIEVGDMVDRNAVAKRLRFDVV
jgi:hypothetical protein